VIGKKALEELKKIPSAFAEKMKTISFETAELDLTSHQN